MSTVIAGACKGRRLVPAAIVLCLAGSGAAMGRVHALFTTSAAIGANSFATGRVDLTDSYQPATALFSVTGLKPDDAGQACIVVTYDGTAVGARNAGVKLYVAPGGLTGTGLGTYLDLTVEEGSGTAANCSDFSATGTIFTPGTLATFADTKTTFATGVGTWTPAAQGATKTYRFTYVMQDQSAAQGKNAAVVFTWESQSA